MSYRKQGQRQYSQRRGLHISGNGRQYTFNDDGLVYKERYFTYYPASKYWQVNQDLIPVHLGLGYHGDPVKWGFDLTNVTSREAWNSFLAMHGFKLVAQKPEHNGHMPRIYLNPDGIYLVTSMEELTDSDYSLGYVRFEAPKNKEDSLYIVLRDFRGPKPAERDREDSGGIVSYVKEETPHKASFI